MSGIGTKANMRADDFLRLPETLQPMQLIEGEVIVSPAPCPSHQQVVFETAMFLDEIKPNGKVWIALLDVVIDDENVVQPDVFWIAEESTCKREVEVWSKEQDVFVLLGTYTQEEGLVSRVLDTEVQASRLFAGLESR